LRIEEPKQKVVAVDFDGVIANYTGWLDGAPGTARDDVREVLSILRNNGWKIIVHSCRNSETIREYLVENKIPFDEINPGSLYSDCGNKPRATVYWDDRACKYSGNAFNDLEVIINFRTWNGRS
jgi:hydroxymethylpyrimidine pyrophosphatase-like HAD family hydrolase